MEIFVSKMMENFVWSDFRKIFLYNVTQNFLFQNTKLPIQNELCGREILFMLHQKMTKTQQYQQSS